MENERKQQKYFYKSKNISTRGSKKSPENLVILEKLYKCINIYINTLINLTLITKLLMNIINKYLN